MTETMPHLSERPRVDWNKVQRPDWDENGGFTRRLAESRLTPDDVELTEVPGYWRITRPCRGGSDCASPLHGFMFNEGPIHHTISYRDSAVDRRTGQFISPYRTWRAAVESARSAA